MRDTFKVLWMICGTLTVVGSLGAAFDKRRGNSLSEAFDRLPLPSKYFAMLGIGIVIGHWVWPMPPRDVNLNLNIEEHA